ncbi:cysteine hydrolase family protein [Streptomyces sp. NPDC001205]
MTEQPIGVAHTGSAATTLRDVIGLNNQLPRLSDSALIMIDFQNTYTTGVMALEGSAQALDAGSRLLSAARAADIPVIHVVNDGGEGTPYDIRAEIGAICPQVTPLQGEPVVVKRFPNSFHDTELQEMLRELGVGGDLVLAGFMTHMCVTFTAQGAFNLGYRPTVVAEATATRTLPGPDGNPIPAPVLKNASLTTITDLFGTVAPTVASLPT